MPSLEIIKQGLMTSIQDLGRKNLAYYAVPKSGVMDKNAAKIALLLLRKKESAPLIECTSIAPKIRFNDAAQIAITGADFKWMINEERIQLNTVYTLNEGDILEGKIARDGFRGYIAIQGYLKAERVYQSYATYINAKIGGFQGRLLKKGDILEWEILERNQTSIPILKGPEFHFLSTAAQTLLTTATYKIGADSNRMGARLLGPKLESSSYRLENSLPVLPGFIQLPPSGLPIILLQDGQVSGGYPRIAYIREQYLFRFNQIPLGGEVKFKLMG